MKTNSMTMAIPMPESTTDCDALLSLAHCEHDNGHLAEAEVLCRKILAIRPESVDACNFLGNVLKEQGKLDEAASLYERTLTFDPEFFPSRYNLACTFHLQGKLDEAVIQYERAIAFRPDIAELHNNLGCIFQSQGKFAEAVASFGRALTIAPDYPEAHHNLGETLMDQGKFADAAVHLDQALALRPNFAEAHYSRACLKTFRAGDADLAALEALAADTVRLPPGKMVYIHFALGKAFEDVGDNQRAFEHWLQGNALERRGVVYDVVACQQTFQLIADAFDSNLLDRFEGAGDPSPVPVFVLGMPRSGSTLVEQILASHPQVHAAGELAHLERIVNAASNAHGRPVPFPTYISALDADSLRGLGSAYLAGLPLLSDGKKRITDKTPDNFLRVGLIHLILPNARIIHTVRDPVDTCVSCFSKLFAQGVQFSYDLAELGCYYRWYHELMEHWRSVLPAGAILDVSYEEVVGNLEEQARRLVDYCGLPWDDRCLSFHETRRPIATASNVQVRQPLYRSSLARWRRYEAYLQPLLAELESCHQRD